MGTCPVRSFVVGQLPNTENLSRGPRTLEIPFRAGRINVLLLVDQFETITPPTKPRPSKPGWRGGRITLMGGDAKGGSVPTGCYTMTVGTHKKDTPGEIPTVLRLSTQSSGASQGRRAALADGRGLRSVRPLSSCNARGQHPPGAAFARVLVGGLPDAAGALC